MKNRFVRTDVEMPFKAKVSFKKVFEYWDQQAATEDGPQSSEAKAILDRISHAKVLREPFDDLSILDQYEEEIGLLLSALFPEILQLNEIKAATLPFQQVFFNMTDRFKNIISSAGDAFEFHIHGLDDDLFYMMSSTFILNALYGAGVNMSRPYIFDVPNEATGVVRTYRGFFNADFSELKFTDRSPKLTEQDINMLLDRADDIELWKKTIPPNSYELYGFGLLTIFDITTDQALSNLKYNLIKKEALQSKEILQDMEQSLQQVLNVGDLKMGMVISYGDQVKTMKKHAWNSILMTHKDSASQKDVFCSHSFGQLYDQKKFLAIPDIDQVEANLSPLFKVLKGSGIKSYLIAPMVYDDQVIGFLELGSKTPRSLNALAEKHLEEIVPLFSIALRRGWDEYETQLEAIIKEECTAIHPSVEWRFFQAAANLHAARQQSKDGEMEQIVFERVYPLFGQMDIKGSSKYRDRAIQTDLITQIELAIAILQKAADQEKLLIYEQLRFGLDQHLARIREKLNAGDEASILDFLRREIEPVFAHLAEVDGLKRLVAEFHKRIDPKVGMIYEDRRIYEETVHKINEQISTSFEKAQITAQKMFPHYFERYKTDGVEYNMYIGQSLVNGREFQPLFLKNLRLWQLATTCEIEQQLRSMQDELDVPLQVASLILVQDKPLDIKFRLDEKQFDVDGAYNARYEIVKKRIDKAHINGTDERLTQPGKIAIVYSNEAEQ
ncbi:MAG: GAF domain-containing protein, partial [Saprospiraceae bacterium]|nr:GAF domain-containing protein [Saprospiraceae bacterium]